MVFKALSLVGIEDSGKEYKKSKEEGPAALQI